MTDPLLLLAQWMSPAFPVGAFAYSSGLETAITDGTVTDAATLQAWLEDLCIYGSGQSDLVFLAESYRRTDAECTDLDRYARAFCPSAERLKETKLQGAAFCETVNAVWGLDLPPLTYPVAVGAAARQMKAPLDQTARLYLHANLSNLTSAAVRLVPLGQTTGQATLAALMPLIETTATSALDTPLDDVGSSTFAADIASMRHETLQPRIFRT